MKNQLNILTTNKKLNQKIMILIHCHPKASIDIQKPRYGSLGILGFRGSIKPTNTTRSECKSEMFSLKQPYHEHQWTKSKNAHTKVVMCNILYVTMEL